MAGKGGSILDAIAPDTAMKLEELNQVRQKPIDQTVENSAAAQLLSPAASQTFQLKKPQGLDDTAPPAPGPVQSLMSDANRSSFMNEAVTPLARLQAMIAANAPVTEKLDPGQTIGVKSGGVFKPSFTAPVLPKLPDGVGPDGAPIPGLYDFYRQKAEAERNPLDNDVKKSEVRKNNTQADMAQGSVLTGDALDQAADQMLAGDTSVMQGLGYGAVGAANRAALRNRITEKAQAAGMSGSDIAAKNAEYFGVKSGERTLGTRSANIDMAVNEASQFADLAQQASDKVARVGWVPVNKALNAWNNSTGDPDTRAFGAANNSFINAYATAVGKGTMTVDSVQHARELLSTADGPAAYKAIIAQLKKEMAAAQASPGVVRGEMRDAITGKTTTPAAGAAVDYKGKYGLQ